VVEADHLHRFPSEQPAGGLEGQDGFVIDRQDRIDRTGLQHMLGEEARRQAWGI
jgi:hypothetical protein